jgi:hypothetical protein
MSQPVSVNIPHALGKEEARRRLEAGFANAAQQMSGGMLGAISFQNRWEGDRMHFEGGALGQGLSGRLEVLPNSIQMQIDVPDLLAAMASRIAGALKIQTQKLLEQK